VKSLPEVQTEFLTTAYRLVLPETVLVGVACVLFLVAVVYPRRWLSIALGLSGLTFAAFVASAVGATEIDLFNKAVEGTSFNARSIAPFDPTGVAPFVRWLSLGVAGLFLLLAYNETRNETASEYAACVLVVTAGVSLVARANDLISLFLALEMISIPTYVLLYLPAKSRAGQEAAAKYFLLSILSSAVLLFGFSYLYGLTGSTNLGAVVDALTEANKREVSPLALVAIMMVIAGLGFRLAAVPFHFYAPDVYEGGPPGVVAQLAVVPKVAGLIALARVLGMLNPPGDRLPFDAVHTLIPLTLWVLAVITMTFGNVMALLQDNLKRLLAYSGIAHGGYMLIGLVVASAVPDATGSYLVQSGVDSILFYLVAYSLMTIGAFAVIQRVAGTTGDSAVTLDDLAGLGQTRPATALAMTVFLLSLIGLPLTAGFLGKFMLFLGALETPAVGPMGSMYRILVLIAAINAAIGAVYYLRAIGVMYLRTPMKAAEPSKTSPAFVAAVICAVGTIVLGVYPKPVADAARAAVPLRQSSEPTRPAISP